MKKESISQNNNKFTKIFKSSIKYFVFIFAFLLVGIVFSNDKVEGAQTIYIENINTSYVNDFGVETNCLATNHGSCENGTKLTFELSSPVNKGYTIAFGFVGTAEGESLQLLGMSVWKAPIAGYNSNSKGEITIELEKESHSWISIYAITPSSNLIDLKYGTQSCNDNSFTDEFIEGDSVGDDYVNTNFYQSGCNIGRRNVIYDIPDLAISISGRTGVADSSQKIYNNSVFYLPGAHFNVNIFPVTSDIFDSHDGLDLYYSTVSGRCIYHTEGDCVNNVKLVAYTNTLVDGSAIHKDKQNTTNYNEGLLNDINYRDQDVNFTLTNNSIYVLEYKVYFRQEHKKNVLTFYLVFDSIQGQEKFATDVIYTNLYRNHCITTPTDPWGSTETTCDSYITNIFLNNSIESYLDPETLKYCSSVIDGECGTMAKAIKSRFSAILPSDISNHILNAYYSSMSDNQLLFSLDFSYQYLDRQYDDEGNEIFVRKYYYYPETIVGSVMQSYLPVGSEFDKIYHWDDLHVIIKVHPNRCSSGLFLCADDSLRSMVSDTVEVYLHNGIVYINEIIVKDEKERTLVSTDNVYYFSSDGEETISFNIDPILAHSSIYPFDAHTTSADHSYAINKIVAADAISDTGQCQIDSEDIFKINCNLDSSDYFTEDVLYFDFVDLFGNHTAYHLPDLKTYRIPLNIKIFNKTLQETANNNVENISLSIQGVEGGKLVFESPSNSYVRGNVQYLTYILSNQYDKYKLNLFYSEGYEYNTDFITPNFNSEGYTFKIYNTHVCNYTEESLLLGLECDDIAKINVKLLVIDGDDIVYSDSTSVSVKNGGEYTIDGKFSLDETKFEGWDISFVQELLQLNVYETNLTGYIENYTDYTFANPDAPVAGIIFSAYPIEKGTVDGNYTVSVSLNNIALDSDEKTIDVNFQLYLYNTSISLKPLKLTSNGTYEEMHSVADKNGQLRYYLNGESVKDSNNYIHIIFQVESGNRVSCPEEIFKYHGKYGSALHETEIPCRFDLNTGVRADDELVHVIFEKNDIQIGSIYNDAELRYSFYIDNEKPTFSSSIYKQTYKSYNSSTKDQVIINYEVVLDSSGYSGMLYYKDDITKASTKLCDYQNSIQIGRTDGYYYSSNTCKPIEDKNGLQKYSVEFVVDDGSLEFEFFRLNDLNVVDYAYNSLTSKELKVKTVINKKEFTGPTLSNTYKTFINDEFTLTIYMDVEEQYFKSPNIYLCTLCDEENVEKYDLLVPNITDNSHMDFSIDLNASDVDSEGLLKYNKLYMSFEYSGTHYEYAIDVGRYHVVFDADAELNVSEYNSEENIRSIIPSNYNIKMEYPHEAGIKSIELVDASGSEITYCNKYELIGDRLSLSGCIEKNPFKNSDDEINTYGDLYLVITDNVNNVSQKYLLIENVVVDTTDPELDNEELTVNNKVTSSQYFVLGDSFLHSSTGDIFYTFAFNDNVEVSKIIYEIIDTIESEDYSITDLFNITRVSDTATNVIKLKLEIKDGYSGEVGNIKLKFKIVVYDKAGNHLTYNVENDSFNFAKIEDIKDVVATYKIENHCTNYNSVSYCDIDTDSVIVKIDFEYFNYLNLLPSDLYIEGYEEIAQISYNSTDQVYVITFKKTGTDNLTDREVVLKVKDAITSTTVHGSSINSLKIEKAEGSIVTYGYDGIDDNQNEEKTVIENDACVYNNEEKCIASFKPELYPNANDNIYKYEITDIEGKDFNVVGTYTIKSRVCYVFNSESCLTQKKITVKVTRRHIVVVLDENTLAGEYTKNVNEVIKYSHQGELYGDDTLSDMISFNLETFVLGKNNIIINTYDGYIGNYNITLLKQYKYTFRYTTINLTDTMLRNLIWYMDDEYKSEVTTNSLISEYKENPKFNLYAKSTLASGYPYEIEIVVKYDNEDVGENKEMIIVEYLSNNVSLYAFDRNRDFTINKGFGKITPKGINVDLTNQIIKFYDSSSLVYIDTTKTYTYSIYQIKATSATQYYYNQNNNKTQGNNVNLNQEYYLYGDNYGDIKFELVDQPNYTIKSVKASIKPDNVAPSVTINGSEVKDSYISTSAIKLEVAATDNNTNRAPKITIKQGNTKLASSTINLSSGTATYTITVEDAAGNKVTKEITVKVDTTDPNVNSNDIALDAESYFNNSGFKVTIPLTENIKDNFEIIGLKLTLKSNSIEIGEGYACVLSTNKNSIECSGKITNKNGVEVKEYTGVIVEFSSLKLEDLAGRTKTIGLTSKTIDDVKVNFSYSGVTVKSFEFKNGNNVAKSVGKVYGAFNSFSVEFEFDSLIDATFSGLYLKVGRKTTNVLSCVHNDVNGKRVYTCTITGIDLSTLSSSEIHDIVLNGTITYTDNNNNISVDVSSDVMLADLKYDRRSITPTLAFDKIDTTNKEITFNVSYDRDEYVTSSASFDINKVTTTGLTLIDSNPIVLVKDKLTIKYSDDKLTNISVKLEADAIIDALGNSSKASNELKLDLSSIDVTVVNIDQGIKGAGEYKIGFTFNRDISFSNEIAVLTYKFGSGSNKTPSEIRVAGMVKYLEFTISITDGDNGDLTIVSITSKNGVIKDVNETAYDSLSVVDTITLSADTTPAKIKEDSSITLNANEYYNNSGFKVTIPLTETIKDNFEIKGFKLTLKDTGVQINDSFECVLSNNKDSIECTGKITNVHGAGNLEYTGINVEFSSLKLEDLAGRTNTIGLTSKTMEDVKVNFSYSGVTVKSFEFKNGDNDAKYAEKVYGAFDSFTVVFEFDKVIEANIDLKLQIGRVTSNKLVCSSSNLDDKTTYTCTIVNVELSGLSTSEVHDIVLNGTITYTHNQNPITIDVSGEAKLSGLQYDPRSVTPTLSFDKIDTTNKEITFNVSYDRDEYVTNSATFDVSKVTTTGLTLIESNPISLTKDKLTIKYSDEKLTNISVKLEASSIVDALGNASKASTELSLDLSSISVSASSNITGTKTVGNYIVSVDFGKEIQFDNNTAILTYKFGSGSDKTVTKTRVEGMVKYLEFTISIAAGDNGTLTIVSISANEGNIKDQNGIEYSSLEVNKDTLLVADTNAPDVKENGVSINIGKVAHTDGKYYLNRIALGQVSISVVFDETLYTSDSKLFIAINGSEKSSDRYDVNGDTITYTFQANDFNQGDIVITALRYYVSDTLKNAGTGSIAINEYNLVYDDTAPSITSVGVKDNKTTVNSSTPVTYLIYTSETSCDAIINLKEGYRCIVNEENVVVIENTITYTGKSGLQSYIVPADLFKDLAGNSSTSHKTVKLVTVSDDKPVVTITDISAVNGNNVYYDGITEVVITLDVAGVQETCILDLAENKCGKYIVLEENKIIINANVATPNDYGNSNDRVETTFVVVDYSNNELEFTRDNENTSVVDNENKIVVSKNVESNYVYQFTSTRDLRLLVSEGTLEVVNSNVYKYSFTNLITLDKVELEDYLGNKETLFEIEHDNEAPVISVESYYANASQASEGITISATISGATSVNGGSITSNGGSVGEFISNTTSLLEFTFTGNNEGNYVITIPGGYYQDLVGNESRETFINVTISNNPVIIPLIEVDGVLVEAENRDDIYYLNDISVLKFKVSLPGKENVSCSGEGVDSECVYTISNTSKSKEITIVANTISVDGISNIETTFEFEEYLSDSLTISKEYVTSENKAKWLLENDNITFIYTINNLLLNSNVPTLIISIDDNEVELTGKLTDKVIEYTYPVDGSYDGNIKVVRFSNDNILMDLAYNVINNLDIADTTNYVIDTTPASEPVLNVVGSNCVTSIQDGTTYYYCANASDISVSVTNLENSSTKNLILTINGEVVNMSDYSYTLTNEVGNVEISLTGTILDEAGNRISVNLSNNSYIVKEYVISVKLSSDSQNIVSEENGYPTFVVTNNIDKYDNILAELYNINKYRVMCGAVACTTMVGLRLNHSVSLYDNSIMVTFSGRLSNTFNMDAKLVLLGEIDGVIELVENNIKVEYDSNIHIDNEKRSISEYEVSVDGNKDNTYIVKDSNVAIKLSFNDMLNDYNKIKFLIGKANSYMHDISYVYNAETNVYSLDKNDLNDLYNNTYKNDEYVELVIKVDGIVGNNGITSPAYILEDKGVNYVLHIDKEIPLIEIKDLVDNSSHKLSIENNIIVKDNYSGLKSIGYYIGDNLVTPIDGYISFDNYQTGTYTVGVIATDNVGNKTKMITKEIYIDKDPATITLESINYTNSSLNAIYTIDDDNSIAQTKVVYRIIGENVVYATGEASISDKKITINYNGLYNYIYDSKLKLVLDGVTDVMGNSSESITTDLLVLKQIEDSNVYLTSVENCSDTYDCKYMHSIDVTNNEEYAINIDNITQGFNGEVEGTSIKISSNESIKGLTITVTLTFGKISVTYDIELENVMVNVDKVSSEDIKVILSNGTIIKEIRHESDYVSSITSDSVCSVNEKCSIKLNVIEKSGWAYEVEKELETTDIGEYYPVISGVSGTTISIDHNEYHIIEQNETNEYSIRFNFSALENVGVVENTFDYSLDLGDYREYTFTYYDTNSDKVAITKTYYVCVVKSIEVSVSEGYKNVHEIDVSDIVDSSRRYSSVYKLSFDYMEQKIEFILKSNVDGEGNVSTSLTNNSLINASYDSSRKVITIELVNSSNSSSDIVKVNSAYYTDIKSGVATVVTNEYEFRFDNHISDDEYKVSVSDKDSWKQTKTITIDFNCDKSDLNCTRSDVSTYKYYLVEDEKVIELENNIFDRLVNEVGTYNFTFKDDAGNVIVIEQSVTNIDTKSPIIDSFSIEGCQDIEGSIYCYSPTVGVVAHDLDSYVAKYHFGYTLASGEIYMFNPVNTSKATFDFTKIDAPSSNYSIYVIVEDAAGNTSELIPLYTGIKFSDSVPVVDSIELNDRISKVVVPNYQSDMEISDVQLCLKKDKTSDEESCYSLGALRPDEEIKLKDYIQEDIENVYVYLRFINVLNLSTITNMELVTIDVTKPVVNMEVNVYSSNGKYYIGLVGAPKTLATITTDDANPSMRVNTLDVCDIYNLTTEIELSAATTVNITCKETTFEIVVLDEAGNESDILSFVLAIDVDGPTLEKGNSIVVDKNGIATTYSLPFRENETNPLQNNIYSIKESVRVENNVKKYNYVIKSTNNHNYALDLRLFDDLESGIKNACLTFVESTEDNAISNCRGKDASIYYPYGSGGDIAYLSEGIWVVYTRDNVGNETVYIYQIEYLKAVDYKIDGVSSTPTNKSVLLSINTSDNLDEATIEWEVQKVGTGVYETLSSCNLTSCNVTENGIYKVTITRFGMKAIKTANVKNIYPDGLFDENSGGFEVSGTNYVSISDTSGYFSSKSTISISYPKVSEKYSLPQFSATIYCSQRNGEIVSNCFKEEYINTKYDTPRNINDRLTFSFAYYQLSELVNGNTITIKIILKGDNETEQDATIEEFEFRYLDQKNYSSANVNLWTDGDNGNVKISQINGFYQNVYLEVEKINSTYVVNPRYYLVINNDLKNKQEITLKSLLSLDEGEYTDFEVYIIDDLGISVTLDGIINANSDGESLIVNKLTIDKTSDVIKVNEAYKGEANTAYVSYEAFIQNDSKFVLITDLDKSHGHVFTINNKEITAPYTISSLDENGNIAFTIEVLDAAGNLSSKDIEVSSFADEPKVEFKFTKTQDKDGDNAILKLSYTIKNQYAFKFEGYYVCSSNDDASCDTTQLITNMNISSYVGKYIKVIATDQYKSQTYDLSSFIDLTNIAIAAPVVEMDNGALVSKEDLVSINVNASYDSINTEKRSLRYILEYRDDFAANLVNNSKTFMSIYNLVVKPNEILASGTVKEGVITLSGNNITKEGRYYLYVLAEDDNIYSHVITKTIYIDRTAPVAKYLSQEVVSGQDAVYSENISVKLSDSNRRESKILYKLNDDSTYTVYQAGKSINILNGINRLEVCDVLVDDTPLNCNNYTIVVDSASPVVSLIPKDNNVDLDGSGETVYGYKVESMKDSEGNPVYVLDSKLSIEDASLMEIDFTVRMLNFDYKFKFFKESGSHLKDRYDNQLVIPVKDNYINWITQTSLYPYRIDVENGQKTIVIDDTTFNVNYDVNGNVESLTPIMNIIYKEERVYYEISLKALVILSLQYNSNVTLSDITRLNISSKDYYGKEDISIYKFDLKNPKIDVRYAIDENRSFLSNDNIYLITTSSGDYAAGSASTMLQSCNIQNDNYDNCKPGLYFQVVKDDPITSSNRLIRMLQHILLVDGNAISSSMQDNLRIYYEGSLNGSYITGFNDRQTVLTHLTEMKIDKNTNQYVPHIFYIMYTDDVGNSSTYYIQIYVQDTIAPQINNAGKEKREVTITSNEQYPFFTYPVTVSDNYYTLEDIKCSFTISYNGIMLKDSYDCLKNTSLYRDDVEVAQYVLNESDGTSGFYFMYKGEYVLNYSYVDVRGNTSEQRYIITVKDNTGIEYSISDNPDDDVEISVNGSEIDLGTVYYNDVNEITLRNFANITLIDKHEFNKKYSIDNLKFFSITLNRTKLDIANVSLNEFNYSLIGEYLIKYSVTNTSEKVIYITYKFTVVDNTPPEIVLKDKDGNVLEENYVENVVVPDNYTSTLDQLKNSVLSNIRDEYTDNYTPSNSLNIKAVSCVSSSSDTNPLVITYTCTYQVYDGSNNSTKRSIVINIIDDVKPTIEGTKYDENNINYTYINKETITMELPSCSDNYQNKCTIYYIVNNSDTPVRYRGGTTIRLVEGDNVIKYYAVDSENNYSEVKYLAYHLDTIAPTIDYILSNDKNVDYNLCDSNDKSVCTTDNTSVLYELKDSEYKFLHLQIKDADNDIDVILDKFVGSVYTSILLDELNNIYESGLYRITVTDRAKNITQREFYVYKETYGENGELNVVVKENKEDVTLTYRDLYLVEFDRKRLSIMRHEEAFAAIKKTDGVYIVGVNDNNEYVKLVKYNGKDVYNTATTIKANVDGISDALINIEGKTYLLMILVENDSVVNGGNDESQTTGNNNKGNNTSYSWIFYVLGVIGVLGGGFLIMKLRNKIRAA